jgi:hypothetical protein
MNGSHNMYRTWLLALETCLCVLQMEIIGYEGTRYEAILPQGQNRYGYTSKGKLHPFLHATLLMSFPTTFSHSSTCFLHYCISAYFLVFQLRFCFLFFFVFYFLSLFKGVLYALEWVNALRAPVHICLSRFPYKLGNPHDPGSLNNRNTGHCRNAVLQQVQPRSLFGHIVASMWTEALLAHIGSYYRNSYLGYRCSICYPFRVTVTVPLTRVISGTTSSRHRPWRTALDSASRVPFQPVPPVGLAHQYDQLTRRPWRILKLHPTATRSGVGYCKECVTQ